MFSLCRCVFKTTSNIYDGGFCKEPLLSRRVACATFSFVKSHYFRGDWLKLLSFWWRTTIFEIGLCWFLLCEEPLFSRRVACATFSFVKSHYFRGEWLVLLSPLWIATIFEESGLCYFLLCEEPLFSRRVACAAFSLVNSHCFRGDWLSPLLAPEHAFKYYACKNN